MDPPRAAAPIPPDDPKLMSGKGLGDSSRAGAGAIEEAVSRSGGSDVRGVPPAPAGGTPPPVEATDRQLVARVLAGDRDGFHALVERHAAPLWSTVRASLGDREEARDVLQETWTRAFERLATLREPERLRSWLLSIALNLVRQRGRRAIRGAEGPLEAAGDPADGAPPVAEGLERAETREHLAAAIAALPPRQREVVDLRVNHDLSHGEIADLLGITEEASRASHYQALRRLRTSFEDPER